MTQPALTRRSIPHYDLTPVEERIESRVEREVDFNALGIKELLQQAEDLYAVRDRANEIIGRIKATIITKLAPVYTDTNQLSFFEDQGGYAIRDPKDIERIVVQHPDVPIGFRLKKTPSTKWKLVARSIAQELERRRILCDNLLGLEEHQRTENDNAEIARLQGAQDAFNWVIEQTQTRVSYRLVGGFTASKDQ